MAFSPLGFDLGGKTPREHRFPIRIRATSLFEGNDQRWSAALDFNNEILEAKRRNDINLMIREFIIPFMDEIDTLVSLRESIESGVFKCGLVSLSIMRFLGLSKP